MPQLTMHIFEELSENLSGDVLTDKIRRYMHSTDGSIFRVEPSCVVYPADTADVVKTVEFARKYGLSIHPRGAGSGLCGSAVGKGIILDFTKYMFDLVELDTENKTFTCQPGYRMGELDIALRGTGLAFPPDPSSGEYASFGGMYATNASGAHSAKYGNVGDYIVDAEFVLSDGSVHTLKSIMDTPVENLPPRFAKLAELYDINKDAIESGYPSVRYNSSGYNLRGLVESGRLNLGKLLTGAEGTLAVVTRLTFALKDKPKHDSLVVAYFDDIVSSAKAVQKLLPMGPSGIEIMDKSLLAIARDNDASLRDAIPGDVDNVLLIEFDGMTEKDVTEPAKKALALLEEEKLSSSASLCIEASEKEKFWAIRKAAVPILYKLKGRKKILALIEDAAVPTDKLVDYFEGIYKILEDTNTRFVIYGHIAKGLLHTRPLLDLTDPHDVEKLKILADRMFELVQSLGGAISGEHGDGRLRSAYIRRAYGDRLADIFIRTKDILDNERIFNPDIKTVDDERQMMRFLRYGTDYRSEPITDRKLLWPEGFVDEVEKCHGCSKCITVTPATRMCPVYKVDRDEWAAPKAKANVLRALISGAISDDALYDRTLQSVISQCVACGSCAMECPSNVNIPKMAMEAKAQYRAKHGPSITDRLATSCDFAGKTTHKFAFLAKPILRFKTPRKLSEVFTGISGERAMPIFNRKSAFDRIDREEGRGNQSVLFFTGCYAGYIRPEIAESAVAVLKRLGYRVHTPPQHCCGVPHLTKGMARGAKSKIKANLKEWGAMIDSVDHVVVTCSTCGLALMKEWPDTMSGVEIDLIKKKTIHISDLVMKNSGMLKFKKPEDGETLLDYHMPCHLRVQPNADASIRMLSAVSGITVNDLKDNCCGMAGSWGMYAEHYQQSVRIGADMQTKMEASGAGIAVTDCPTCNMQMDHMSDKDIQHPIEIIARWLVD